MEEDKFISEEMMAEINQIYQSPTPRPHPGYRVYFDTDTNEIICFSQEELPHPWCPVTQDIYETYRPDLFCIVDGRVERREEYYQNRLQLKPEGSTFTTLKDDMQFAVDPDHPGEVSRWDRNV
jgi:hypothetical protein